MKQRSTHKIQKQLDRELRHRTWLEKNHARVLANILEMAELIGRYFTAENAGEIEERLAVLMEPFMRKGKDKSHTDANEDRDDSGDIEEFALS